jgi:hypothetical protein
MRFTGRIDAAIPFLGDLKEQCEDSYLSCDFSTFSVKLYCIKLYKDAIQEYSEDCGTQVRMYQLARSLDEIHRKAVNPIMLRVRLYKGCGCGGARKSL